MKYTKPPLSLEQQADQLIGRGLIADRDLLIQRLSMVSYYRLSGYWHVFRQPNPDQPGSYQDEFIPDTTFEQIWNRYTFDRHLRLIAMDAIERIEILVRTKLAYHHGHEHGAFGYAETPSSLPELTKEKKYRFLSGVLNETSRSKDTFVKHFDHQYSDEHFHLPIWMAVEIMSFGGVFTMFLGCSSKIRQSIAAEFGIDAKIFESWLKTLNTIRNICAHHGRLWNRELGLKPKIPRKNKYPQWHDPVEIGQDRIFGVLTICKWSLDRIAPQSSWHQRFKALLVKYPDIPLVSMGFPKNWEESPIWNEPDTQQQIYNIALKVREAIKKLSDDRHPVAIRIGNTIKKINPNAPEAYPHNWCDYASCVLARQLARYLADSNIELCKFSNDDPPLAHWWLRYAGFDIDITADQYDQTAEPVIVEQNSQTHQTHFDQPTVIPFFSRNRQSKYFELLVNRLDDCVNHILNPDRAKQHAVEYLCESTDLNANSCLADDAKKPATGGGDE